MPNTINSPVLFVHNQLKEALAVEQLLIDKDIRVVSVRGSYSPEDIFTSVSHRVIIYCISDNKTLSPVLLEYLSKPNSNPVICLVQNANAIDLSLLISHKPFSVLFTENLLPEILFLVLSNAQSFQEKVNTADFKKNQTENDLIVSELKFRSLFEKINSAILYIDSASGEITDANIAAEKLFQRSKDELIDITFRELVPIPQLEAFKSLKGLSMPFAVDGIRINSGESELIINFELISFEEGVLIAIGIDVTRQQITETELLNKNEQLQTKMEELQAYKEELIASNDAIRESNKMLEEQSLEFRRAKEKAEESDRLKTAFLQNMSHEIRTPMNGIIGFGELLILEKDNPKTLENYLRIITNSSKQLLTIVDDILDISLIESGEIKMFPKNEHLNEIIGELFEQYSLKAREKKLSISTDLTLQDPEDEIIADKTRVKQVYSNLINNALKFTGSGEVSFGYKTDGLDVICYVRDTGIGIPAHLHQVIFERFSQVEYNLNRTYGGTGLGLAISKNLVELMKGTIWVESKEHEGSSFYFRLPGILVHEPVKKIESCNEQTCKASCKILVAEDDETNYYYLHEILSFDNIDLIHAQNGLEAVRYAKLYKDIDLILMDIKMPEMNGLEATRRIREFLPSIPIIAQTAFAMPVDKEEAFNAGCTDYLSKPINRLQLLEKVMLYTGFKNE